MRREKIYINEERFKKEIAIHHGERHTTERVNGRRARLWVQSDLAAILHITKQHLTNVKRGKDAISEGALNKLAEVWKVTPEYLRGLSDARTVEEGKKNNILSQMNLWNESAEMRYLAHLVYMFGFSSESSQVECIYPHDVNEREPKSVYLTSAQMNTMFSAMNKAADAFFRSCLEVLEMKEEADDASRPEPE